MTSIISRFTSSLMGWLDDSVSNFEIEGRTEDIRSAMVDSMLMLLDERAPRPAVWGKILDASCVQTLWYLRIDLMALLSDYCGETAARQKIASITEMFRGVIPANQMSKSKRFSL